MVKSTLRGTSIRNSIGVEQSITLPVTPNMLYKIVNEIDLSVLHNACVWMTCVVMFYGLLRKSNVVDTHKVLCGDCKLGPDAVEIHIK